ncbi:hypothetical protein [Kitasatospora purpeofusca]|uniref:hypothetical protein n=1 Tax=Kitasatospora purpeofusca TaxID=67352 RepID=UPI002259B886|nr:hypothetical protein [Kitasatospora purpeofusca]MCX4755605.1 hypothetical protein [Kitasatospora purpeofusca]WSR36530.1 hypothetical protein OG715_39585 [Kitasatospora purpeofusca]WSR44813.1 hypothetical protein OG196_40465 [Kitasatospora purpeofusca]
MDAAAPGLQLGGDPLVNVMGTKVEQPNCLFRVDGQVVAEAVRGEEVAEAVDDHALGDLDEAVVLDPLPLVRDRWVGPSRVARPPTSAFSWVGSIES